MDVRGRLTVPDAFFVLMTIAFLGALYPVFYNILEVTAAPHMGAGALFLWQLILPFGLLVITSMIFIKATAGVR